VQAVDSFLLSRQLVILMLAVGKQVGRYNGQVIYMPGERDNPVVHLAHLENRAAVQQPTPE